MSPKGPPFEFFVILQQNACLENKKGPLFYIFGIFRNIQVFSQKKMFCAFWALDIAPTLDVPVLLTFYPNYIAFYKEEAEVRKF